MRKLVVAGIAAAMTLGVWAAPVAAAPPGEAFTLDCDTLGVIEITTGPGQGLWTPGFVVGSTQRLIPYAFRFEFGGEVEEVSKRAPRHGRLDRCEFGDDDFSGVVWLSYSPSR